jgi:proline racemase
MLGCGGKMYSFCAMYSFRMSFCVVPPSWSSREPCFCAVTRYIAQMIAAGELMVIDVVTSASLIPSKSVSMSFSDATATPQRPTSPSLRGWSLS